MRRSCFIFIGQDECARIFGEIALILSLEHFRIVEPDAVTFVLHPMEVKIRKAKSFNALWEKNAMKDVLVVLASTVSDGRMNSGFYYPHVFGSKSIRKARELFEKSVVTGGYWLTPAHPTHHPSQYSRITFVGKDAFELWRHEGVVLGNEAQRYFEPAPGEDKRTTEKNSDG